MVAEVTDSVPTGVKPLRPAQIIAELGIGKSIILDSYLTPITYDGTMLTMGFEHSQATGFSPTHAIRQLAMSVGYSHVENPVRNNTMHSLMLHGQWSLMRRWQQVLSPRLQVAVGGALWMHGGVIYNEQNSNNVVSVKAHAALALSGMTSYNTMLCHRPIILHIQATIPVVGIFFSPDYDESYYEMYLGNRHNLAHVGCWANRFDMNLRLSADWHLGGTIVRLGYRLGLERSWVNELNTHITGHEVVIGVGGEFLSVNHRRNFSNRRTVSALY